eukprot:CAMPEP_0117687772 /NCGR_PEP_ID=MMETSP0804-20121206/23353_1 /TAXON_ID=1074897 /ORGANISM="Tetraselmis astigmatica, Strain CCMP880" /LENGTH=49 /DNA_ID= /DNA_START= /DNA_END= /DNA_ORIENTATION=
MARPEEHPLVQFAHEEWGFEWDAVWGAFCQFAEEAGVEDEAGLEGLTVD